jgi:catechol 2,3-dioxygenase-like lactoylglutathione lyase family enzyme
MQVERVHHVGIAVADLDAAIVFYCGIMGFTLDTSRPEFSKPGCWLNTGASQVHLIELADEAPGPARHWAFEVDDLDAWTAHFEAHGVEFRRSTYRPGAGRQVFVKDPSGNAFELNQPDR